MDLNNPCLFCHIGHEKLYQNEDFFSIFDAVPVSPGHALVIPNRHLTSLFDLTQKEWNSLYDALNHTKQAMNNKNLEQVYKGLAMFSALPEYLWDETMFSPRSDEYGNRMLASAHLNKPIEDVNIGVNDGIAAGRTIHHLHVQVIPRYDGDVKNPRGGMRNILSHGNYTSKQ